MMNGNGVANARVIFRVISGRGRLSERGNGRAIGVQTDSSGYARANFTPLDDGDITVRASADGVSATVEFTITTGSAALTTQNIWRKGFRHRTEPPARVARV